MSTSLLYHAFGVRDYRYVKTEYVEGGVIFTMVRKTDGCRCSVCGSENVWRQGSVTRPFRTLPIGRKLVTLRAESPRLLCHDCGTTRQAVIGFAEPRRTYSTSFERYALELSQHMTIKDVADHLGVSWDVVKDIQKRYLHNKLVHLGFSWVLAKAVPSRWDFRRNGSGVQSLPVLKLKSPQQPNSAGSQSHLWRTVDRNIPRQVASPQSLTPFFPVSQV